MKTHSILLLSLLALMACDKTQAPLRESLESLRKIHTAVGVGVSFEQYNNMVIDAKVRTDATLRVLPDGEIKTELNATMNSYVDAVRIWGKCLKGEKFDLRREPDSSILPKYSIQVDSSGQIVNPDEALGNIWRTGDYRLSRVEELLR